MAQERPPEPGPEIEDDSDLMAEDAQNTTPSDDDAKVPAEDKQPSVDDDDGGEG